MGVQNDITNVWVTDNVATDMTKFRKSVELLDDGEGETVQEDGDVLVSNVQRRRRRKRLKGRSKDGDTLKEVHGERSHGNMVDSDPGSALKCERDALATRPRASRVTSGTPWQQGHVRVE